MYKLGFDGSSGQSQFRHMSEKESISDSSVYITTVVLIRIVDKMQQNIVWQNPSPSTRYCRPVRISYEKENVEAIKEEYNRIQNEIDKLESTKRNFINISIQHTVLITMLDGKSVNAIEDIKMTQICYICKATSKTMNDLSKRNFIVNLNNIDILKYGISPLHARIKFMEFILK